MRITLTHIGSRSEFSDPFGVSVSQYLDRCTPLARCQVQGFRTEEVFFDWIDRLRGRTPVTTILLDSRGRQMNSEAFASWLGKQRDQGAQQIVFAVGPADGWSETARARAQLLLSLGSFTLAHGLARLVMAEQLYRACTILAGHPYHRGQ